MASDLAEYAMNKAIDGKKKDHVIIFATSKFDHEMYKCLSWVDADVNKLQEYWEDYSITLCHNATVKKMQDAIKTLVTHDVTEECSCVVLIFLTYGDQGLVHATDNTIALQTLLAPLKECVLLGGKPKICILQTDPDPWQMDSDTTRKYCIPSEADYVYLWSTVPAQQFQPDHSGSLFITCLLNNLNKHKTQQLTTIMRRTIDDVEKRIRAMDMDSEWLDRTQELPYLASQLRKALIIPTD